MKKSWVLIVAIILSLILIGGFIAYYFLYLQSKPQIDIRGFMTEALEKRWKGYDVYYAINLALQAKYYYEKGDTDRAYDLYDEAVRELKNAELLPTVPVRKWNYTDSNINIDRLPTTWDLLPIGVAYVKSKHGYLAYPSNDLGWKLSCYILVAYGENSNSSTMIYQGRIVFTGESPMVPRFCIDNNWLYPFPKFYGPMYYEKNSTFATIYNYDLPHEYMQILTFYPKNRTYIHKIFPLNHNYPYLKMVCHAKGVPFWMGEWNSSMIIHGVVYNVKDLDLWGGYWEMGDMNVVLALNENEIYKYNGWFLFDKAMHHTYYYNSTKIFSNESIVNVRGAPLSFSCCGINQDDLFNIMLASDTNPSPLDVPLQHQARINLLQYNESYPLNFSFEDNGGLQPSRFYFNATYPKGNIHLIGDAIGYYPPDGWKGTKGTWWNPSVYRVWGRAFIHWQGTITYNDKIINVDCIGIGEFTRCGEVADNKS